MSSSPSAADARQFVRPPVKAALDSGGTTHRTDARMLQGSTAVVVQRVTDDSGRYEISEIPPRTDYKIGFQRGGYVEEYSHDHEWPYDADDVAVGKGRERVVHLSGIGDGELRGDATELREEEVRHPVLARRQPVEPPSPQ